MSLLNRQMEANIFLQSIRNKFNFPDILNQSESANYDIH